MSEPVDLHVHSLVSDGRDSPVAVVERAATLGVGVLVFADHSVATWSADVAEAARSRGVEVPFPAMEVSVYHGPRKHHVLLYGPAALDPALAEWCLHPIEVKNASYRAAVETLRAEGIGIPPFELILAGATGDGGERHPYKRLGSRTLIARYVAEATGDSPARARERVAAAWPAELDRGDRGARLRETHLPALDTIERGRRAGGFVVLAHPLWECGRPDVAVADVLRDVEELVAAGLQGLETSSYHHPAPGESPELAGAIRRLGLLKSGGSDYHGNGRTEIGERGLGWAEWQELRDAVADGAIQEGVNA